MNDLLYLLIVYISILKCAGAEYNPGFVCGDGTQISFRELCNGKAACNDNSDESRDICFRLICPVEMYRCIYGACIDKALICDGKSDCVDNSDERQCGRQNKSCNKDEYKCLSGECIPVTLICNDKYDCKDGSDESEHFCDDYPCPKNSYRCKNGACIHNDALCNGFPDCIDSSDESEQLCKSLNCTESCTDVKNAIKCPAVTQSRIKVTCKSKNGFMNCKRPVPAGTTVYYECLPHFEPINHLHFSNKHMQCQSDGTWSRRALQCKPECGKAQRSVSTLVLHGKHVQRGEYPWYSALYVQEDGNWTFWCGGSLITEKTILTAAHCTWNLDADDYQVALGKLTRDYHADEQGVQFRNVQEIVRHPLYQDFQGNFGSDIAILVLKQMVSFSSTIGAVCLDWDMSEYYSHISDNSTGVIVGMGLTEKDVLSDRLKVISLPVVSNDRCIKKQNVDFKKYVTYTAFCAGWLNGTGVCNGDSGGGLTFPMLLKPDKWIVQGIVSISPRRVGTFYCDPKYYTVFTKVSIYIRWIQKILNRVHSDIENEDTEFLHSFAPPGAKFLGEY